jgi:hypothetical protein
MMKEFCCDEFRDLQDTGYIALDHETGEFMIDNSNGNYPPIEGCHICPYCGYNWPYYR